MIGKNLLCVVLALSVAQVLCGPFEDFDRDLIALDLKPEPRIDLDGLKEIVNKIIDQVEAIATGLQENIEQAISIGAGVLEDLIKQAEDAVQAAQDKIIEEIERLEGLGGNAVLCIEDGRLALSGITNSTANELNQCAQNARDKLQVISQSINATVAEIRKVADELVTIVDDCAEGSGIVGTVLCITQKITEIRRKIDKLLKDATLAASASVTAITESVTEGTTCINNAMVKGLEANQAVMDQILKCVVESA